MSFVEIFSRFTELHVVNSDDEMYLNFEPLHANTEARQKVVERFVEIATSLRADAIIVHEHHHAMGSQVVDKLMQKGINTSLVFAHERISRFPGAKYNAGTLEMGAKILDSIRQDLGREFRGFFVDDVVVSGSDAIAVADILPQAGGRLVGIGAMVEFPETRAKLSRRGLIVPLTSLAVFRPETESFGTGLSSDNSIGGSGRFDADVVNERLPSQHHKVISNHRPRITHPYSKGTSFRWNR